MEAARSPPRTCPGLTRTPARCFLERTWVASATAQPHNLALGPLAAGRCATGHRRWWLDMPAPIQWGIDPPSSGGRRSFEAGRRRGAGGRPRGIRRWRLEPGEGWHYR